MTEQETHDLLQGWQLTWGNDLPPAVRGQLNELRRILIEIHCPTMVAEAKSYLEEACRKRMSE